MASTKHGFSVFALVGAVSLFSSSASAQNITLPAFELQEENAIFTVHTQRITQRKKEGVYNRWESYFENGFVRHITRQLPLDGETARWKVGYLERYKATGAYENKKYVNDRHMGTSTEIVLKDGEYFTENEMPGDEMEGPFTEEDRQTFIKLVGSEGFYQKVSSVITSRRFKEGESSPISPDFEAFFGGSGSIELTKLSERWGQKTTLFTVKLDAFNGMEVVDECAYRVSALVNDGRLTDISFDCEIRFKGEDDITGLVNDRLSYAYSDIKISAFSPEPVVNIHPRGSVKGIKYLPESGLLAYLSKDGIDLGQDKASSWLTFWDLNKRKAVYTSSVAGDKLTFSPNSNTLAIVADNRMAQTYIPIVDKFTSFGQFFDFDLDRGFKSSGAMGKYIVTLNEKNELEVINPGYRKLIERVSVPDMQAEQLAVSDEGKGIVINQNGELRRFDVEIDHSRCSKSNHLESWCKGARAYIEFDDSVISLPALFKEAEESQNGDVKDLPVTYLEIHPIKPIAIYCSEDARKCGVINYQEKTHQQFITTQLRFSSDYEQLVSYNGRYPLNGQGGQWYESAWSMFGNDSLAVASDKNTVFVGGSEIAEGTNQTIVDIRTLEDGTRIDKIKATTAPITGALAHGEVILTYSSDFFSNSTTYQFIYLDTFKVERHKLPVYIENIEEHEGYFIFYGRDMMIVQSPESNKEPGVIQKNINDSDKVAGGLIYSVGNQVYRYQFASGEETLLYTLDGDVHEVIALDDQGQKIAARMNYAKVALPHADKVIQTSYANSPHDAMLKVSEQGDFLLGGGLDGTGFYNSAIPMITRYDVNGNQKDVLAVTWGTQTQMYSPDGKYLWVAERSGNISVKSLITGTLVESFPAHQGKITTINRLSEGVIMTTSTDGTIKLWNEHIRYHDFNMSRFSTSFPLVQSDIGKRNHKLIATIIIDKEGEVIASTPDGYYWGTPKGVHRASFVEDRALFDYRRYDLLLNRPDIVLDRIGIAGKDQLDIWTRLVEVRRSRQPSLTNNLKREDAPYDFTLTGPKSYLAEEQIILNWQTNESAKGKLHISVNESPVYGLEGQDVDASTGESAIALSDGVNTIRAYLSAEDGTVSRSQTLSYYKVPSETKPELYILAVGVSGYQNSELNLNYASKDAKDITALFGDSEQFSQVHVQTLLDDQATKDRIEEARAFIQKAGPNDRLIVFFAGHGMLDQQENYFFGTTDINPELPQERGLSYKAITDLIASSPSRYKLLLLDTCHSGEVNDLALAANRPVAEGVISRGFNVKKRKSKGESKDNLKQSYQLLQSAFVDLRASTGAVIISAAGGLEYALEESRYKNGVFTSSVLKGLAEQKADSNGDGVITTSELRDYTYSEVTRLTGGAQTPTTRSYNLDVDFALY
ncbi:caspase family protein [Vibrio sp. HN007]|uniref:caspase family protein n=1 Tax=Vibrio iocasae TaxID=3098914 RepID=UPI0035D3FB5A